MTTRPSHLTQQPRHTAATLAAAVLLCAAAVCATACHDQDAGSVTYTVTATQPSAGTGDEAAKSKAAPQAPAASTGDGTMHRMATHIPLKPLRQLLCDSNAVQLRAAQRVGIEPIGDLQSAYLLKRPIVAVETCQAYKVNPLRDSMPYLVPEAEQLLHDIGQAFQDTINARGGKLYRVVVTSLLRTDYTVAQLQKRNLAATQESCHRYGTTFDLSWTKFDCMDPSYVIDSGDLKNILGEVILKMRDQGRCYAIFEAKQACYHVTVRPQK